MSESALQMPFFTHTTCFVSGVQAVLECAQDTDAWSLAQRRGHTSNGREEDAEEHQEAVGTAHVDGSCWYGSFRIV
jgi:hypothetical protein